MTHDYTVYGYETVHGYTVHGCMTTGSMALSRVRVIHYFLYAVYCSLFTDSALIRDKTPAPRRCLSIEWMRDGSTIIVVLLFLLGFGDATRWILKRGASGCYILFFSSDPPQSSGSDTKGVLRRYHLGNRAWHPGRSNNYAVIINHQSRGRFFKTRLRRNACCSPDQWKPSFRLTTYSLLYALYDLYACCIVILKGPHQNEADPAVPGPEDRVLRPRPAQPRCHG